MRLGLSLCLLGLPVLLGYCGFQIAESRGAQVQRDQTFAEGLRDQKAELARVRQETLAQLEALTTRIATLQARFIRLDAFGARADVAGAKPGGARPVRMDQGSGYQPLYDVIFTADPAISGTGLQKAWMPAVAGLAGRIASPHVDFRLHKHGRVIDPASYLNSTFR